MTAVTTRGDATPSPRRRPTSSAGAPGKAGEVADVVPIRPERTGPGELVPSTARVILTAVTDPDSPDHGLWVGDQRAADLPVVLARLAVRDGAGKRRGWQYLLAAVGDSTSYLCSSRELSLGEYVDRVGLDVPEDRTIRDACVTVIRRIAREADQRELVTAWSDGRLALPPVDALPTGYLDSRGTEAEARAAWRELGALACAEGAENLALNLGGAYAAPYPAALDPVQPVSFALVGIGRPRRGKSTNVNAAAGWYGSPGLLNVPISESSIAIADQLANQGVLPLFRDEIHSAGWTPAQWHNHWSRTLNGAGRRRSSADGSGNVRGQRGWWGIQWMSGNVDPRFGATDGVQARVIALNDPHQPGRAAAKRVKTLLGQGYGWPVRWQLAEHVTPDEMRKRAEAAYAELVAACAEQGFVPDGSADTVAECLGLCVAGAELAGALIDAPGLRAAAVRSALRVLHTLADGLADQSVRFGDQLLDDVADDVQRYPAAWPACPDYEAMRREQAGDSVSDKRLARNEVHGFRLALGGREVVCMQRSVFQDMVARRDYAVSEALGELRDDGRLLVNAKTGFRYQKKINGTQEKFYAFRLDTHDQGDGDQDDVQADGPQDGPEQATMAPAAATTAEETTMPAEPGADDQGMLPGVAGDVQGTNEGESVAPYLRIYAAMTAEQKAGLLAREPGTLTDDELAPAIWAAEEAGDQDALARLVAVVEQRDQDGTWSDAPAAAGLVDQAELVDQAPAEQVDHAPAAATSSAPSRLVRNKRTGEIAAARNRKRTAEVEEQLAALAEGRPLRLLRALETTHKPLKTNEAGRMSGPFRAPEMPRVLDQVRVISSWAWSRPWAGEVIVLDRNAAWPSAVSSVEVAHGALVHTGAAAFCGRPGMYEVAVYQWAEELLPSPLGHLPPGTETVWITAPQVKRLIELYEQGRWPDVSILDSYTGEPVRLKDWTEFLKTIRTESLSRWGRESDQYGAFKEAFGMACSLMLGKQVDAIRREWECELHRPDWTHAIQSQASMSLHRWADECAQVTGNDLAPISLQNVDELVIPAAALEIVTTQRRPGNKSPLKIDESGIALGTFKVKRREVRDNG